MAQATYELSATRQPPSAGSSRRTPTKRRWPTPRRWLEGFNRVSASLKAAFQEHLRQTKAQDSRLEQVFGMTGKSAKSKTCEAMKGLVAEGE